VLDYKEEDDDVLKRLNLLNDNYHSLNSVLQGEDSSIILVYNPDILSLRESERLVEGLHDLNLPLRLLINNKVKKDNEEMSDYVDERMGQMARDIAIKRISLSKVLLDGKENKLYDVKEDIASAFL
jgi:anion-transporting  ArsA/GET3 family ATPase